MEKYVNRSTGVLLQPAQESVAAMLGARPDVGNLDACAGARA